ncbi:hypothetical protein U0E23_31665, partial [Burkholderia stagnalis]|uniref:hypothetical protein n=1 Tax=Burkholderia stagnalis TaxID=1503054 RepID=UPI002AB37FC6
TYRLLIFKERFCEKFFFLSSAALSAAEKRDYEHCFAVRQQLFNYFVATAGFIFLRRPAAHQGIQPAPLPLPRCVAVSAKEA